MRNKFLIKPLIKGIESCIVINNKHVQADHVEVQDWCTENTEAFTSLPMSITSVIVFYGVWAGKGIGHPAVAALSHRYFFVDRVGYDDLIYCDPHTIEEMIPDLPEIIVLPEFCSDARRAGQNQQFSADINRLSAEARLLDQFIYETFEIEEPGAGLLVMPVRPVTFELFFKTAYTLEV